ncbi:alpha/beta fold hydrolase [Aurantimonas sp. 22II-16-19i]|uniref:alpha/beta hydrolase n=1 Tax=Aurantimonas sp. 22II-16-19i TaxID=1317114 RepID=UPI0009F7C5DC|nr:alpha/beta fold hydrolase [Aurantimonas sp. 22II-16-19i]ORE98499.1 dienelactone hydrolase [Aurantimonas sp. 22II-16-19i]
MTAARLRPIVAMLLALLALAAIGLSLLKLHATETGVTIEPAIIAETPATIFRPEGRALGPVVVIAHGFAGSQQLMQSFALAFARNGYGAVTFDFLGHGRNPAPLAGSITEEQGATRALVDETAEVAAHAKTLGDGRLAVLGHSMASDIVVRFAAARPDVAATIAVSMFSPEVTADAPRNLLVIVGEWEGMLKREALRVVELATAPAAAEPGVTYGDPSAGTARRAAFSPNVEHASVLFSQASLREAFGWLDAVFAVERQEPPMIAGRGPWIMLLIAGCTLLARQLTPMLPRLAEPPAGAGLRWRRLWPALLVPAIATPLLLRVLPTHFLPVLVGDYLAMHFLVYGLLTALCLRWQRRGEGQRFGQSALSPATIGAALAVAAFYLAALVWPIDSFMTSFVPTPARAALVLAMLVGTLAYFLADEWATRGPGSARFAYAASKLAFVVSLAFAVALDFERLFFLIIIVPVIALFFLVFGAFSAWIHRATGQPLVAALANALAFAWAIGVTFPLLAG